MPDLLDIADQRRSAGPSDDEQVEVVVVHDRDTEVRVYEGEIESLSSAETQGIGVRVVADGRQGFASAGTLDADVLAETLAEARDNARFGEPDEFNGLAEPDGVAIGRARPLRRADLADVADRAQDRRWPSSSNGPCGPATRAHHRHRVGRVRRLDRRGRRSPPPPASAPRARESGCVSSSAYALADRGRRHPDRLRLLGRPGPRRSRHRRGRRRRRRAGHPPARRDQARHRARSPSCSIRSSPPSSSAIIGGDPHRARPC